jgi:hypothetical protein
VISREFEVAQQGYYQSGAVPYHLRSPEQIAGPPAEVDAFGGVGRKP